MPNGNALVKKRKRNKCKYTLTQTNKTNKLWQNKYNKQTVWNESLQQYTKTKNKKKKKKAIYNKNNSYRSPFFCIKICAFDFDLLQWVDRLHVGRQMWTAFFPSFEKSTSIWFLNFIIKQKPNTKGARITFYKNKIGKKKLKSKQ